MNACATCRHWLAATTECRRYAPRPVPRAAVMPVEPATRWPLTAAADGCGEWEKVPTP